MPEKKGFFQKSDTKKQYSENVLNNVESAYRPKHRGRVRNPISSNTMSGEDVNDFEEQLTHQDRTPQERFKKPVGYAFAGPQAKRQKEEAQAEVKLPAQAKLKPPAQVEEKVLEEKLPEPEIQVRTGKPAKKKTDVAIQKRAPKKSKKMSQPEIQVRTGNLSRKLSEPEIQVRTGNFAAGPTLETYVAFELLQAAIMLEAMQVLEEDVHETKGNYEPIEETQVQSAKSLGFRKLFGKTPFKSELQYELDLDSIGMEEFQQTKIVEAQPVADAAPVEISEQEVDCGSHFMAFASAEAPAETVEVLDATDAELFVESLSEETPAAELGLSFDPDAYRRDKRKTQVLNIPKQGIKRSNRGTIEAVFQPNGKVVEAQYNRCGILTEVSVGRAMKLTRSADTGNWTMSNLDGSRPVNRISNVAFDRLGNLCYSTEDGRTTVICADGRVLEK